MINHIKRVQEIKATKKLTWVSYITNFMFFLMFSTQSLFGQLPVPILVMMLTGAWANIWVLFHFLSKTDALEDKEPSMIKVTNNKALVITAVLAVIALISTLMLLF